MFSAVCSFDFQVPSVTGREPLTSMRTRGATKTIHFRPGCCKALLLKQNPCPKTVSSVSEPTNSSSFTADYLINSCGLSPTTALSLASRIHLSSAEKPDSVLTLFHDNGFTQAQITHVISRRPDVLVLDPDRTLKPKLEFFHGLGVSDSDLGKLIAMDPSILARSLEKQILPSIKFLKNYLDSNDSILMAYKRYTYVFRYSSVKLMELNIGLLRESGVPERYIAKLLVNQPRTLMLNKDKFKEIVGRIKEMGFNASSPMFCHAVRSMASLTKENWDKKMLLFQSFGWSEEEMLTLFRKQPIILTYSEKKMRRGLKYFIEERKWSREDISISPWVLYLSLEKRIIPRYAVLDILISSGVEVNVGQAMKVNEGEFLAKFVIQHHQALPEVLKVYRGGTGIKLELAGLQIHSGVTEMR